jgi:hypothetical protein
MSNEVELKETIVVEGAEAAVSKLSMLAGAAQRLVGTFGMMKGPLSNAAKNITESFGHLREMAGSMLGIAGMWKVAETVHDTDRLYQAVQRVKDMTGMAAGNAHAMFDMFELSGIGGESAESIIMSMTRSGQRMATALAAGGTQGQKLNQIMNRLGLTVKSGPEERLFAMAKAAEKGKLGVTDLITAFNIPRTQASQMLTMLKQGPEKLKDIQADTLKGAHLIDEAALESHRAMLQARRELADAWGGVVGVLYKNLLPAVTEILKGIKGAFEDIYPIASKIGSSLSANMELVVTLTKTYLALLIAAKSINMFSSEKLGILGRGRQLFGMANGAMAGRAASAGAMDYFAARAANPAASMFANAGGPLIRVFGSVAGRLGLIGLVISALIGAFMILKNNVLGLRDLLGGTLARIWDSLKETGSKLLGVFKLLFDALKPVIAVLGGALVLSLQMVAWHIELFVKIIGWAVDMIVAVINAVLWLINQIPGVEIDYIGQDPKTAVEDSKRGTGDTKPPETYQDFRGSKFEIMNNFPPGIDGGRVAVAFGDELARLGERRLDSGVRPLYSYR